MQKKQLSLKDRIRYPIWCVFAICAFVCSIFDWPFKCLTRDQYGVSGIFDWPFKCLTGDEYGVSERCKYFITVVLGFCIDILNNFLVKVTGVDEDTSGYEYYQALKSEPPEGYFWYCCLLIVPLIIQVVFEEILSFINDCEYIAWKSDPKKKESLVSSKAFPSIIPPLPSENIVKEGEQEPLIIKDPISEDGAPENGKLWNDIKYIIPPTII